MQGFSPGTYQLYACALDTMGARACQTASITVNPPAAVTAAEVTNAVSTITAIDTDQLKATGGDAHQAARALNVLCMLCVAVLCWGNAQWLAASDVPAQWSSSDIVF
jgi:hypothetical protein